MLNKKRLKIIVNLLNEKKLEGVFVFSTKNDFRYANWLFGREPLLYNYFFVSSDGIFKILEIDYLCESLGKNLQKYIVKVNEENKYKEGLEMFSIKNNLRKVGIVGLAPFSHFLNTKLSLVDLNEDFDELLLTKDEKEISEIKSSAKIINNLFKKIDFTKYVNKTEVEIAKVVKEYGFKYGEQESFPTSVVTGDRLKNATAGLPSNKKFVKGEYMAIDCGFLVNKFYTDITRMFFLKNDVHKKNYDTLVKLHHEIIKESKAGITLQEISNKYKDKLSKYFKKFILEEKDLGHSIGFGLHEIPIFVSEENKNFKIKNNMIFTLEPEIVVDGWRYRVEDMVLCINDKFEILTK